MVKYIAFPGVVTSKSDGDIHFIGYYDLCRLYNVNPADVLNFDAMQTLKGFTPEFLNELVQLSPREDGKYTAQG
jgi:hypothetical protein